MTHSLVFSLSYYLSDVTPLAATVTKQAPPLQSKHDNVVLNS